MGSLLVLYDDDCPLCIRCRAWLEGQRQLVPLRFASCRDAGVQARFRGIRGLGDELVVVADDGRAWVGPSAFLVCLWALDAWRGWSWALCSSLWLPIARWFFTRLTNNRSLLGELLGAGACHEGHCGVASGVGPYR